MMYQGFFTLIEREVYRFSRLSRQTIFPPIITTLLFIFIFGFSLGASIRQIEGFSYIMFILPGLASMSVITNAYANTSTSLFMARMDRSIENTLIAPVTYFQMALSLAIGGILRGLVIGLITLLVGIFSVHLKVHDWPLTLLVLTLSSIIFSNLGIISALQAEGWDSIAMFTNFLITPLVYLGGVFYSIQMLPPFWHKVSLINPIFYLVDSLRYSILGTSAVALSLSLGILVFLTIATFAICVWLFKIGYKMVT
ncbi:MAG: ABC transporter permease [Deltaproteobacteria bacterium]|nr:ABC transporter permease [Deltaproteobacteria bacterium]